jgi:anaerobic magnesium-protoporphyrin IX monomethyl ester cyclase
MPDVLIGQAYYLRFDAKMWQARQPYPPLGALYAAACLRERGVDAALFDAMIAESVAEWDAALARVHPSLAVIYEDSFNYLTKMCLSRMREAAFEMIDGCRRVGCPVIVSGSDATDHPEAYLARGAAAVVLGEGEITLAEAVDALLAGRPIEGLAGTATLSAAGALVRGAVRPFIAALDQLPYPAWDLVDLERYRAIWRTRHGYHSMNLATTRGCPYHCNWCAKPIYGQRYAVRSPGSVVEEIAWLKRTFAPDHLWIVDDVFGLKPGWIADFAALAAAADVRIPYRCLMRADQVTAETARALAASGCRTVWMGAESGSQRVLDAMEKGQLVEYVRAATQRLKSAGIAVGYFLQFGYPGETWTDIEATLALVRDERPDDIGVSVSYPLPGTKFHERVQQELGSKRNWVDSSDLAMMYRGTYTPDFYRQLHGLVHSEFRAAAAAAALGTASRRPWTVRARHLRAAAALVFYRAAQVIIRRRLTRMSGGAGVDSRFPDLRPALSRGAASRPARQDDWAGAVEATAPAGGAGDAS